MIRDRKGAIIYTNENQNRILKKLYGSVGGRILLKILTVPTLSKIVGAYMDSPLSKPLIEPFVRKNRINVADYETEGIRTYNEFFTRKIKKGKRNINMDRHSLISPCDAKLSVYKICKKSLFRIKGSCYSVNDLLGNSSLARKFEGGLCLIFRLEVDDYHRYIYFDSGIKGDNHFVKGVLHTVNPIALRHVNIYKRNSREYTLMNTENFGIAAQIEVGAMMVGRIKNHDGACNFLRGEEKGMFLFGGSTVVLMLEKDKAVVDDDILYNSIHGFETIVKLGEKIGVTFKQ